MFRVIIENMKNFDLNLRSICYEIVHSFLELIFFLNENFQFGGLQQWKTMPNEKEINRLVMMGAFVTGPRTKFLEKKMERIKSKKKVTKERACSGPNPPAMGHFSGSPHCFSSRKGPTQPNWLVAYMQACNRRLVKGAKTQKIKN